MQDRRLRRGVQAVLDRNPGGDDAEPVAPAVFHRQVGGLIVVLRQFGQLAPQFPVGRARERGDHDLALDVAFEMRFARRAGGRSAHDDALGVADAGGDAEQNRNLPLFRHFKRADRQVVGFLRIGRFEHRQPRRHRVIAVVLFVLAGGHAGVVRAQDHQPAVGAGVGHGEKRVGGDVQPDMLHGDQRPGVRKRRTDADFQRHFFVRGPLGVSAQRGEVFENLGGRSTGIADAHLDAAVQTSLRDRLVPAQ